MEAFLSDRERSRDTAFPQERPLPLLPSAPTSRHADGSGDSRSQAAFAGEKSHVKPKFRAQNVKDLRAMKFSQNNIYDQTAPGQTSLSSQPASPVPPQKPLAAQMKYSSQNDNDHRPGFDDTLTLDINDDSSLAAAPIAEKPNVLDTRHELAALTPNVAQPPKINSIHIALPPKNVARKPAPGRLSLKEEANEGRRLFQNRSSMSPSKIYPSESSTQDQFSDEDSDDQDQHGSDTEVLKHIVPAHRWQDTDSATPFKIHTGGLASQMGDHFDINLDPPALPVEREMENQADEKHPPINRFQAGRGRPPATNLQDTVTKSVTAVGRKGLIPSKTSSLPDTSSEDGDVQQTPENSINGRQAGKRLYQELDHDPESLKSMTFPELMSEPFHIDPRHGSPQPAIDQNGNPMTLSQRLQNLSQMQPNDQVAFFRSQTDSEWQETGSWFMDKFASDLKKLMELKFEKRKVLMRYEHEIQKRQKLVEVKMEEVQNELQDLKEGGNKLIKDRHGGGNRTPVHK